MSRERHLLWAIAGVCALLVAIMVAVSPSGPGAEGSAPPATANADGPITSLPVAGPDLPGGSSPTDIDLKYLAPWQVQVPPDVIRLRLDSAEAGTGCERLVALTSLPDLNQLPDQTPAEVEEYFTRWLALAAATLPSTDQPLTDSLSRAQASMTALQRLVDDAGGRFSEEIAAQFFNADPGLGDLVRFYTEVAGQCDPPADFTGG